jgi:AcrR family transcriptional regulator
VANVKPQARGIRRRRQLVDAAIGLFACTGSRGTGIAAVAHEAGVTNATLLHHFGSKDALLQAVLEERDRREAGNWNEVVGPGGLQTVRNLVAVAQSWLREPGLAKLHVVLLAESIEEDAPMHDYFARRQSALRTSLRDALERGQRAGEIRGDVDARSVAVEVACFLDGVALQWHLDPQRIPLEATFEAYAERLVAALGMEQR